MKKKKIKLKQICCDHDCLYGLDTSGNVYVHLSDRRIEKAMFGDVKTKWGWRKLSMEEI